MAPPFVLFDLDNTLVDRTVAIRRLVERLVGRRPDAEAQVAGLLALDRDGLAARSLFFDQTHARLGLPGAPEDLQRWYDHHYPQAFDPLPDATAEALAELRAAGTRIAIVTNGSARQEAVLRHVGLAPLVDAWVVSEVDGARKPDARAFRLGATRSGVAFARTGWMVGDNPLADIAGARAAGIRTAWLRRGRAWQPELEPPTVEADDVPGAVAAILAT